MTSGTDAAGDCLSIPTPAGLVIAPGAGADRDNAALVSIEAGLPEIPVERLTLATTSVPRAVEKISVAMAEFANRLGVSSKEIALGGRSFGGRSCSVGVAEGAFGAAGLVLLSYPLHPPGKKEKLRVDHFGAIDVPTLFVSGLRDPFGSPAEFNEHVRSVSGPVRFDWIKGNHSPRGQETEILDSIRSFFSLRCNRTDREHPTD